MSPSASSLIDQSKNPHQHTRDIIERAAGENQFTHGKLAAVEVSMPTPSSLLLAEPLDLVLERRLTIALSLSLCSLCFPCPSLAQSYRKMLESSLFDQFPDLRTAMLDADNTADAADKQDAK